jgi:2-succinyl-5-enolpyruvyl-6-hydroxy-3-cyclohexene-1-carboxylate synthase
MGNVELARRLVARLRAAGVREVCVCAGSRNSPLLYVLGGSDLRLFSFFDERSAAFFALGRIKLTGNPVAVVTTSGTAVAELLPATIEAYYSAAPLILVTADRPARFRGTGAPQSIEQVGIFGVYAESELETWSRTKPLHSNVEFDEPLIDEPLLDEPLLDEPPSPSVSLCLCAECQRAKHPQAPPLASGHAFSFEARSYSPQRHRDTERARTASLPQGARPLVILSALPASHRPRVKSFAQALNAPVYAEALSGLREDPDLPLITSGERMLPRGDFDSIVRIGNVPTVRYWRDLETSDVPIVHFSDVPFPGMTRGEVHPLEALPSDIPSLPRNDAFFDDDRAKAVSLNALLDNEPHSELAIFRQLSTELPEAARIYLGNSLPIREWDLSATRAPRRYEYEANRGANGIDGQLSTFFGQCDPARENVCVVGDLTALYDLNAPWIVRQLDPDLRWRIVVINNGGGRIFSRVGSLRNVDRGLRERIIENVHGVRFHSWAAMWNIEDRITELLPDEEASRRVWERYDALWA